MGEPLTESPDTAQAMIGSAGPADCLILAGDGSVQSWAGATAALASVPALPRVTAAAVHRGSDQTMLLTGNGDGPFANHRPGVNYSARPPRVSATSGSPPDLGLAGCHYAWPSDVV